MSKRPRTRVFERWYCDDCDGCGWTEGGVTLKTRCVNCAGTGIVFKFINPRLEVETRFDV